MSDLLKVDLLCKETYQTPSEKLLHCWTKNAETTMTNSLKPKEWSKKRNCLTTQTVHPAISGHFVTGRSKINRNWKPQQQAESEPKKWTLINFSTRKSYPKIAYKVKDNPGGYRTVVGYRDSDSRRSNSFMNKIPATSAILLKRIPSSML